MMDLSASPKFAEQHMLSAKFISVIVAYELHELCECKNKIYFLLLLLLL